VTGARVLAYFSQNPCIQQENSSNISFICIGLRFFQEALRTHEKSKNEFRSLLISPRRSQQLYSRDRISENSSDAHRPPDLTSGSVGSGLQQLIDGLNLRFTFDIGGEKTNVNSELIISPTAGPQVSISSGYTERLLGAYVSAELKYRDIIPRFGQMQVRKESKEIIAILQTIEPSLIDISIGPNGVLYADIGLSQMIPLQLMGDGIVRMLSILLTIYDLRGGIVYIDEIENGFHYASLQPLWMSIIQAATAFDVQLFITTHSMEAIRALSTTYSDPKYNSSEFRLYRLERAHDQINAYSFLAEQLGTALDNDFEVR
jgi:hypothetical protein